MTPLDIFLKIRHKRSLPQASPYSYEFCPRCEANLTLQKGYSNTLPYWICKGCGEMLINPSVPDDSNISWICDGCGEMLNIQEGFTGEIGDFTCRQCGYVNRIDPSAIYLSEDEYQAYLHNPYKGLSDEDMLELSAYEEIESMSGKPHVILVRNQETGDRYIKKIIEDYDISVYRYLLEHPIAHMPGLVGLYESDNCLIIIEEYIEGQSLDTLIHDHPIDQRTALKLTRDLCQILASLHSQAQPIIHRDIKPSNIIISQDDELYLLDMNVAKWYKPEQGEDTRMLGTIYYAAPEQFGYGFSASSAKSDIYAVGVLLNVLLTGKYPKEKRAEGPVWDIIGKCISFEPADRYTAIELVSVINSFLEDTYD